MNCLIRRCPYNACMSDHCQFHVSGPMKGHKRMCGLPLLNPKIKRRYNLHYRIRKQNFTLITSSRTIFLSPGRPASKSVMKLRDEFGYSIQIQMF